WEWPLRDKGLSAIACLSQRPSHDQLDTPGSARITSLSLAAAASACGPGNSPGRWWPVDIRPGLQLADPVRAADPPGQHLGRARPAEPAGALPAVTAPRRAAATRTLSCRAPGSA